MDFNELYQKLASVCTALDNTTVTGIKNLSNIAGCYAILNDIMTEMQNAREVKETESE